MIDAPSVRATDGASRVGLGLRLTPGERKGTNGAILQGFWPTQLLWRIEALAFILPSGLTGGSGTRRKGPAGVFKVLKILT